jgi:hypothetical protein
MHGKMMTTPRGTEMLELPFNLSGRRNRARREVIIPERVFRPPFSSDTGSCGGPDGTSRPARRKRSIGGGSREARWCVCCEGLLPVRFRLITADKD